MFDFDNISSIFDVEEQLAVYQLQVMAFAVEPGELTDVLLSGLQDVDRDLSEFGVTWTSPENILSRVGVVSYTWTGGIRVTDNIRELWKALDSNGFDVWVCSASCTGAIRAAIDTFGLHDHCTGVLAMTNKTDDDGRYLSEFDYENGKRTLRSSNSSILFGSNKEVLFKNADNETQLQRMIDDKMTTEDIINTWSLKQEAGANGFDFNTGFLTEYAGYHSHP